MCFGLLVVTTIVKSSIVAKVNGEPIETAEFQFEMLKERSFVYGYFVEKFKLGEEPLIWTKKYNNEIPLKVLQQRALKKAITIKVLQLEMKKYGLQKDISYQTFKTIYQQQALQKSGDIKNGKVVYGLPSFTESNYFTYVFDNQLNALKMLLFEKKVIKPAGYAQWLNKKIKAAKVTIYAENLDR